MCGGMCVWGIWGVGGLVTSLILVNDTVDVGTTIGMDHVRPAS